MLTLSACSFGGLVGSSAPATYDLKAPAPEKQHSANNIQLTINTPVAVHTIDTVEVLVKGADGRVTYISNTAWGDRLPLLFQARLADTFANSGRFKAILTNQDRVSGDLSLSIEIRDFQVETTAGGFEAVIDVYAKLIDEHGNRVVRTHRFQERSKAPGAEVATGVQALNTAFQKVALDMLAWVSNRASS